MKPTHHTIAILLGLGLMLLTGACKNPPTGEPADGAAIVQVDPNGEIQLYGRPVALEELKFQLLDTLIRQDSLPGEISIDFHQEILMGMRGEVRTETSEALRLARLRPALDTLQAAVADTLRVPIALKIDYFNVAGDYAFAACIARQPNGQEIDFRQTPFYDLYEAGVYSNGVFGLLKNEQGQWRIITVSVGATDVPFICWWKEFGVPMEVFPEGGAAADCL